MKFEELATNQLEEAKNCKSYDERMAFLKKYSIELSDDQLDEISGGDTDEWENDSKPVKCLHGENHRYVKTGKTRPGVIFGNFWPDYEMRCVNCSHIVWTMFDPD